MFHFHTDWNLTSPPCILFSRLVWRKFVAATWDYISQPSTSKQNPIRCYYVRAGDITLSSLGRLGRTVSARGGGWRARGRPVQLHSPHCCCHRGERDYFKNNHTRGGVLLNKGPWHTQREKERSQGRWLPILGSHCEDSWRRRDGSARFQMPAPAWALERPTGSMSLEFCFVSFWALQCQQIDLKTDWPYRTLWFVCARVREWESEWVRGDCVQAHLLVFWQESYGIWRARRALRWHPHQERWDFPSPGYIYTVAGAGKLNFKVTARKIQFVWLVSAH